MKWLPLTYVVSLGAIVILYALPFKPQTGWAMGCITIMSLVAMLLAHWEDQPFEDGSDDQDDS